MLAYSERTRRVPNVPLTYISVFERMSIRSHTLMPYAIMWLHFYIEVNCVFANQMPLDKSVYDSYEQNKYLR